MRLIMFLLLTACVHHTVLPAAPRTHDARLETVVQVRTQFGGLFPGRRSGLGVLVSDRHVLTAQHVVESGAELPEVEIVLHTGEMRLAVVVKEDLDKDLALLELRSANNIGFRVPPPAPSSLLRKGDRVLAVFPRGVVEGEYVEQDPRGRRLMDLACRRGDSGGPVYTGRGYLIGLVLGGAMVFSEGADGDHKWVDVTEMTRVGIGWEALLP